jgi:molecular chaperone GrpE
MAKGNGKSDVKIDVKSGSMRSQDLKSEDLKSEDLEHELPAADSDDANAPAAATVAHGSAVPSSEAEKLKIERDALLDRLARLQAEFDNARKRAQREQQDFREFAAADAIRNFLPVLDSFERALKTSGDSTEFRNGIELIYKQFQDALQKIGVQPILSVGQVFDPRVHEAIEMVDTAEFPDHQVVDELQRGYKYKDRLLRPAMVRVARNHRA